MWHHQPLKVAPATGCKLLVVLNSVPVLNYSLIFVLVHPGAQTIQTSRDIYALCSKSKSPLSDIQIRMWQKCSMTPFHPHIPFFFPRRRALKGDMAFARVSPWHGGWVQLEVNMCSCTWELAHVPRSHSAARRLPNFVQSAQHGVHTKLKGKCQVLFILASVKANT